MSNSGGYEGDCAMIVSEEGLTSQWEGNWSSDVNRELTGDKTCSKKGMSAEIRDLSYILH